MSLSTKLVVLHGADKTKTTMFRLAQDADNLKTYYATEAKTVGHEILNTDVCMEKSASTNT